MAALCCYRKAGDRVERALLVGVDLNDGEDYLTSLEELGALAEACDMEVVATIDQTLTEVHKAFYIGTGKVEEVKELAEETGAEVIIFDNSLSPMQMRMAIMENTTVAACILTICTIKRLWKKSTA